MTNQNPQTKKPLCIFTTGLDVPNEQYAQKMLNSLRKTNPDIDKVADIKFFKQADAIQRGFTFVNDLKMRFMTPIFMKELIQQYECVVRLDADMIITGDISSCWDGDFDVAVVQNANPRELAAQQALMGKVIQVWDINPMDYVNCGFVVVKSEEFVDHWLKLCTPERTNLYQFYEQDFLNILCFYGNYKIKFLDRQSDNKWHGLISKGFGSEFILKGGKLILPNKSGEEREPWPIDNDKEIVCIHAAGGQTPTDKFADIDIKYTLEVAKWLKELRQDEPPQT